MRRPRAHRAAARSGRGGPVSPAAARGPGAGRRAGPRDCTTPVGSSWAWHESAPNARASSSARAVKAAASWPSRGWTVSVSVQRDDHRVPRCGVWCSPPRPGRARSQVRIARRHRQPYTAVLRQWRSTNRSNAALRCVRRASTPVTASTHSAAVAGMPAVAATVSDRAMAAAAYGMPVAEPDGQGHHHGGGEGGHDGQRQRRGGDQRAHAEDRTIGHRSSDRPVPCPDPAVGAPARPRNPSRADAIRHAHATSAIPHRRAVRAVAAHARAVARWRRECVDEQAANGRDLHRGAPEGARPQPGRPRGGVAGHPDRRLALGDRQAAARRRSPRRARPGARRRRSACVAGPLRRRPATAVRTSRARRATSPVGSATP